MPTDDELDLKLEAVTDAATFLVFVRALIADRETSVAQEKEHPSSPYGPDAGGWENVRIEDYLDAAARWAESTNVGLTQGLDASNPWRRFAHFLYLGKIYE